MPVTYKQCQLQRTAEPGAPLRTTVSYIPSKYAIHSKFVDLKEKDSDDWNTWQVTGVGTTELSEEQAKKIAKRWHQVSAGIK